MSALVLVPSIVLFVILNAGTCIVFFKPGQLRFAEVPSWLLAVLAGPEARRRLLRIMDGRERAGREEIRERVECDIKTGAVATLAAAGASLSGAASALTSAASALRADCGNGHPDHEVLWVEGRGRVCLTCGEVARVPVSVNGTVVQVPWPR